ncbi:hypothetical protein Q73A0000_05410 [Kaistella flava (ex Peng et al. 2021)]|uniref:Uncharacterized protein n=1 Tax=Kaistella flava (ex Peng et al. 2021) TaxID=2038776 RepID=A0A7M2Y7P0_9FLAO|nr:hypothetical protein [Kaistella flava (ex Peng et al. 2021)]QOW09839.1 hypothetical protein Q73A0000_05410 [Kaistella flava (ex Peng et al. 2021)]
MKIDFIELEKNIIEFGLDQLSDSLKALLYEYDQSIFDDFYFDSNYLEPQLFYLFSKKNIDSPLQYILNKYMNKEKSVIFD